jgi:hypothetical protein
MALAAATVWEIRNTNGSDTNGGGFVAGATGTDYSQQNAKNTAGNNISTTNAVTNNTTTVTSATASFTSAIVGNIIYLSGTGTTTGWYQVVTFTNSTTIVVDRATGSTGGTGVTMNIGGALATISQAASNSVSSNKLFVQDVGTYAMTASTTLATTTSPVATVPFTRLIGYTTTRGDNGKPTIQATTNSGITCLNVTGGGWIIENFIVDGNSLATSTCVNFGGQRSIARNIKAINFLQNGDCEVTSGKSGAAAGIKLTTTVCYALRNWVHDNVCSGIVMTSGGIAISNIISNNTGATSDGIVFDTADLIATNTIYGNGRDGIRAASVNSVSAPHIFNNILSNNSGWGMTFSTAAGAPADPMMDGNGYFNNTSGTRTNADDTTVNKQNNVAPYTNAYDVVIAGSVNTPFTNAGSNDFSLNANNPGGANFRGVGKPATWPGLTPPPTSYRDFGAVQHADPTYPFAPLPTLNINPQ